MGLFDVLSGSRRAAKGSADAMLAALSAAAPSDAQVSADRSGFGMQHFSTKYVVSLVGSRRGMSGLVDRMAGPLGKLDAVDELQLRIAESAADGAVFSAMLLGGLRRDRADLDHLVRAHDELVARIPDESVLVDGHYAGYKVSGVAREDAVATARLLAAVWEDMLAVDQENWVETGITLEIGGTAEEPEISYTVELGGAEDEEDLDAPALPLAERQQEARRAIAAWTEGLEDLAALVKVRGRSGFTVRFGFTPLKFKPRLVVEDLESGDEDDDEATEVLESIRFHRPATKVKVG